VFALLFGSPLASTFLGLEIIAITGHNLYVLLIPVLVASTAGFFAVKVVTSGSFDTLADLALPAYTDIDPVGTCSRPSR
jgi:H+/Cl- antiporter ClcA